MSIVYQSLTSDKLIKKMTIVTQNYSMRQNKEAEQLLHISSSSIELGCDVWLLCFTSCNQYSELVWGLGFAISWFGWCLSFEFPWFITQMKKIMQYLMIYIRLYIRYLQVHEDGMLKWWSSNIFKVYTWYLQKPNNNKLIAL